MALRQLLSKALLPKLERDVSCSVAVELATVGPMVDNMLAPQAFAYNASTSASTGGGLHQSAARASPASDRLAKLYYPVKSQGMFKGQKEGWHGTILKK